MLVAMTVFAGVARAGVACLALTGAAAWDWVGHGPRRLLLLESAGSFSGLLAMGLKRTETTLEQTPFPPPVSSCLLLPPPSHSKVQNILSGLLPLTDVAQPLNVTPAPKPTRSGGNLFAIDGD